MHLVEKIMAKSSGRSHVEPGDVVVADVDVALLHDLSSYSTGRVFDNEVGGSIAQPERVVMVFDHIFSPPGEEQANVLQANRNFARKHGCTVYDCGNGNLHHVAMRNGHIRPGVVVAGSDSHSPVHGVMGCVSVSLGNNSYAGTVLPYGKAWLRVPHTISIELVGQPPPGTTPRDVALWLVGQIGEGGANYAALRFEGEYIESLGFWDRWLFPLMAVDVGAKAGYMEPDAETLRMADQLGVDTSETVEGDDDPPSEHWRFDVSSVPSVIAFPPTIGNIAPISDYAGTPVQRCELGGHGGGRTEDIAQAASIMAGASKHPDVLFNVVPSSRAVFTESLANGYVEQMHLAGATWFPSSDGSNQAINMGAMAKGEAMLSTQARNYPGRNGSKDSSMFLASALSVAASALNGRITDPREVL